MIVQCDKCGTKFRISEEKVTERGLKVRCGRCTCIFIVRRSAPATALGAAPSELETGPRDPSQTEIMLQGPPSRPPASTPSEQAAFALGFGGRTARPALNGDFDAHFDSRTDSRTEVGSEVKPRSADLRSLDLPTPDLRHGASLAGGAPREGPSVELSSEGMSVALLRDDPGSSSVLVPPYLPADPPPDRTSEWERASEWLATELLPVAPEKQALVMTAEVPQGEVTGPSGPDVAVDALDSVDFSLSPAVALAPVSGGSGDIPGLLPPGSLADPFDEPELVDAGPELPPDGAYANFGPVLDDLSGPGAEPPPPARDHHEPLARIALESPSTAGEGLVSSGAALIRVAPADLRDGSDLAGDPRGLWPSAFGAVLGLVGVLLGFPEVGRPLLAPFAPEPVLAVLGYLDGLQADAVRGVRVVDIRVAPYRAVDGRTLLVVTGRARNDTSEPIDALTAVVRVYVKDAMVAREEVAVGLTLRPRVLYHVVDRETLEAARAEADGQGASGPLSPGDERGFMAVFYEAMSVDGPRRVEVEFHSRAPGALSSYR